MNTKPIQKILFGSPGTGKSHRIKSTYAQELGIEINSVNYIPSVFHPEYTYGDFMGKLMPLTNDSGKVEYKFYSGHFLKALAQAYKNIIATYLEQEEEREKAEEEFKKEIGKTAKKAFSTDEANQLDNRLEAITRKKTKNVLLVIDEINRGNSGAIFGTVFQLLDRDSNGWSSYPIVISELEFRGGLIKEMSFQNKTFVDTSNSKLSKDEYLYSGKQITSEKFNDYQSFIFQEIDSESFIQEHKIKIPSNLHVIATMNTSDNSIYFMDNAFKRRWDWEFVDIDDDDQKKSVEKRTVVLYKAETAKCKWVDFVDKLNEYIRSKHKDIRKIEDKQIGYRFINEEVITEEHLKNKLMFFLWDSVFSNNKKPLADLLGVAESEIVTFGQFTRKEQVENFVDKILNR
ncbi:hypothetical protein [Runella sp.]|uniref:hypothetical protein n=1 Tax=Runella sp. TaxID=1960881 RepID=UPI002608FCBD|nr:hypothetical protein [Runella sp.]